MRLIGRERLVQLQDGGEHLQKWVCSWASEIADAHWKHASDVRSQFPAVSHQGGGQFQFRVGKWAISLLIAFPQGVALITDLNAEDEKHGN